MSIYPTNSNRSSEQPSIGKTGSLARTKKVDSKESPVKSPRPQPIEKASTKISPSKVRSESKLSTDQTVQQIRYSTLSHPISPQKPAWNASTNARSLKNSPVKGSPVKAEIKKPPSRPPSPERLIQLSQPKYKTLPKPSQTKLETPPKKHPPAIKTEPEASEEIKFHFRSPTSSDRAVPPSPALSSRSAWSERSERAEPPSPLGLEEEPSAPEPLIAREKEIGPEASRLQKNIPPPPTGPRPYNPTRHGIPPPPPSEPQTTSQVKELEKQSQQLKEKVAKLKEFIEELETKKMSADEELSLIQEKIDQITLDTPKVEEQLANQQETLSTTIYKLQEVENESANLKAKLTEAKSFLPGNKEHEQKHLDSLQAVKEHSARLEELTKKRDEDDEYLSLLLDEEDPNTEEMSRVEQDLAESEASILATQKLLDQASENVQELDNQFKQLLKDNDHKIESITHQIDENDKLIATLKQSNRSSEQKIDRLTTQLRIETDELEQAEQQLDNAQLAVNSLKAELQAAEEELGQLQNGS